APRSKPTRAPEPSSKSTSSTLPSTVPHSLRTSFPIGWNPFDAARSSASPVASRSTPAPGTVTASAPNPCRSLHDRKGRSPCTLARRRPNDGAPLSVDHECFQPADGLCVVGAHHLSSVRLPEPHWAPCRNFSR